MWLSSKRIHLLFLPIILICGLVFPSNNPLSSDEVQKDTRQNLQANSLNQDKITEGFKELIYLEAYPHHAFDAPSIDVQVGFWQPPEIDSVLAEQIDSVLSEQARIDDPNQQIYSLRLDVFSPPPSERLVFNSQIPFHLSPLKFKIPTAGLEGVYLARPRVIDPAGTAHEIWYSPEVVGEKPYAPTIFLGIHHDRDYVMESIKDSSAPVFTHASVVGNPSRSRYPKDDQEHSFARSVWDLHYYDGRIYVGGGDWDENQGPVDIWSFAAESSDSGNRFQKEITVDDESVNRFRSCGGRLVVPGIDATESWEFGNVYFKERGKWHKRRTLENAVHVMDAAFFADKLYVSTATELGAALYESDDWGKTWKRYSHDNIDEFSDGGYTEIAVIELGLIVMPGQEYLYLFNDGKLGRLVIPLFPGLDKDRRDPHRLTPFMGGVLYTDLRWEEETVPKPLFFLKDLRKGAVVIQQFQQDWVQDIVVRNDMCYVLACHRPEGIYTGYVYQSRDLTEWSLLAQFDIEALPYSLEYMDGVFYVGLAALAGQTNSESGNIYRLDP